MKFPIGRGKKSRKQAGGRVKHVVVVWISRAEVFFYLLTTRVGGGVWQPGYLSMYTENKQFTCFSPQGALIITQSCILGCEGSESPVVSVSNFHCWLVEPVDRPQDNSRPTELDYWGSSTIHILNLEKVEPA